MTEEKKKKLQEEKAALEKLLKTIPITVLAKRLGSQSNSSNASLDESKSYTININRVKRKVLNKRLSRINRLLVKKNDMAAPRGVTATTSNTISFTPLDYYAETRPVKWTISNE